MTYSSIAKTSPEPGQMFLESFPSCAASPQEISARQSVAREAAAGKQKAAWQLLQWIKENDRSVLASFDMLDDDRLATYVLEWIALGTWAGQPCIVPRSLHSPVARMHFASFFLPRASMQQAKIEHMLLEALHDHRPALRQTSVAILGLLRDSAAIPALIDALHDPVRSVQLQAIRALGQIGGTAALSALLNALQHADELAECQIFSALAQLGSIAVAALLELSTSSSSWIRWLSVRALGKTCDFRVLPALVRSLADPDSSVAWMAAKGLPPFGKSSVGPILRLLVHADTTLLLVETSVYVLKQQHDPKLKQYIEPVIQQMREPGYLLAMMFSAQKALTHLLADGLGEECGLSRHTA